MQCTAATAAVLTCLAALTHVDFSPKLRRLTLSVRRLS